MYQAERKCGSVLGIDYSKPTRIDYSKPTLNAQLATLHAQRSICNAQPSTFNRCRANVAHKRRSRPDSSLGSSHCSGDNPSTLFICSIFAQIWKDMHRLGFLRHFLGAKDHPRGVAHSKFGVTRVLPTATSSFFSLQILNGP